MESKREAVKDFILTREGEVQGLQEFSKVVEKRKNDQNQNTFEKRIEASSVLACLNRLTSVIDASLINLDLKNSENPANEFFTVINTIRGAISKEISDTSRDFGLCQGGLANSHDIAKTLDERIRSSESTVRHQKELLEKVEEGSNILDRPVGTRPIPTKDKRIFDSLGKESE